jgi:hypothetical protein
MYQMPSAANSYAKRCVEVVRRLDAWHCVRGVCACIWATLMNLLKLIVPCEFECWFNRFSEWSLKLVQKTLEYAFAINHWY